MSWSGASLIDVWHSVMQNAIDAAINNWRKRLHTLECVQTDNILNSYRQLVVGLKKLWTNKMLLTLFMPKNDPLPLILPLSRS